MTSRARMRPAATAAVLLMLAAPGASSAQEVQGPVLRNADEIPRFLGDEYPTAMRLLGVEGTATVAFTLDRKGKPRDIEVVASTGLAELDKAARDVADKLRFEAPEGDEGSPLPFVRVPIEFQSSCGEDPGLAEPSDAEMERLSAIATDMVPKFVLDSLREEHVAVFDIEIDETGTPQDVEIETPSGYSRADELGAKLLREARFQPVTWRGDPVPARFRHLFWLGGYLPRPEERECAEETKPRVTNMGELASGLGDLAPAWRPGYMRPKPMLRIYIDEFGFPLRAFLSRSSCWPELDRELLAMVKYMQIRPARCDGERVATWIAQRVDFPREW